MIYTYVTFLVPIVLALRLCIMAIVIVHVLLTKRDVGASIG